MNIDPSSPGQGKKGYFKMAIRLLDDNLINKIAAGEVIERPASIVKELIENSLDAGSTRIKIRILGGGVDEIEIEDNGHGILAEDLPMAFLRHATSKISSEEDLEHIHTMGFRGEALPSIASVSCIDLFSKAAGEDGVYLRVEGGQIMLQKAAPAPAGTRIVIKNLFYNTPARRKFLKSQVTEGTHIHDLVWRYALSRPDVSFTYTSERKAYFKTPGNDSLRDSLTAIYGLDFSSNLFELDYEGDVYSIKGLISSPEVTKSNRKHQQFFVNERPIRSPLLYRAIDTAYRGMLISREFPLVFLSITMDPALVDVNVHPQKSEVRFREEQNVFRIVQEVMHSALTQRDYHTSKNFLQGQPDLDMHTDAAVSREKPGSISPQTQFLRWDSQQKASSLYPANNWVQATEKQQEPIALENSADYTEVKIIGQVFNSYILLEKDDSLWMADQHAAHERILFSQLLVEYAESSGSTQALAFPIILELSRNQIDLAENNLDAFRRAGFDVQIIGHRSIALHAVPVLASGQERDIVLDILDKLEKGEVSDFQRETLASMACKRAVKAGMVLSREEMAKIITDLFLAADYKHCPHGRPTIIRLTQEEMARMFKRI